VLLLQLAINNHQLQLQATEDGRELLFIDGQLYAEKNAIESPGEFSFWHPELGALQLLYQTNAKQTAIDLQVKRDDEVIFTGQRELGETAHKQTHVVGILGLVFKLFKSAKAVKVLLAGSALAGWSIIFSWQFAIVLIAVISFHEYGHVWAMRRSGMKTKGMYLIPFVGGVAIGDKAETHWQQVFIAMMGPLFGLGMSVIFYLAFMLTENHFIGLMASISALINVFNLLPILPLDGGQVVKAMVFSGRSYLAYVVLLIISAAMFALSSSLGLTLLSFFVILGVVDLLFSYQEFKQQTLRPMDRYGILFSLCWYLLTIAVFIFVILSIANSGLPGSEIATAVLQS
jgi:Zn-dependent protease